jgi:hypothetical protein
VPGGWQALYTANKQAIGPDPNTIQPGTILVLPQRQQPMRYIVAPGDTLSGIAAALAVPGGWQALYTANRQAIGPNPNLIRPGVVLMSPRIPTRVSPRPAVPSPRQQPPSPAPANTPHPATPAASAAQPAATAGSMPKWLEDVLLAAGVLAATAFASEPVAALTRRRRQGGRQAGRQTGRQVSQRPAMPIRNPGPARCAVARARIILADHERLIVTYSTQDDTVYVLTPPGEDPRAVLRAARLILPERTYEDLANHLGVPAAWPIE